MPLPASLTSIPIFSLADHTHTTPAVSTATLAMTPTSPAMTTIPPATPTTKTLGPLLLSSALPPVPTKVVEKVQAAQYAHFKDLLADNIALLKRLSDVGVNSHLTSASRMREIEDPLTSVLCFLAFMAAKAESNESARDLAAYSMLIIHMARKHGGRGWVAYDSLFRQQKAAWASCSWAELNPSLMAATVLGSSGVESGKACSICMASAGA